MTNPWDAIAVIVETEGGRISIMVDELLGQQQVVIKSLGERFKNVKGISGGAILGDGKVGLILDVSGIREASLVCQN
jgi:two-component system chemotaxis sensor kinase CheA